MTRISRFVLLLVACACTSGTALAQKYPVKPIRFIVPFPAGDTCDILARLLGQHAGERLGQQFVVDNRAGGSGSIGLGLAAQAPADGYTIACGQGGNMSVLPHSMKNIPYDVLKDFTAVSLVATNYLALIARPDAPYRNVAELIQYLKANPGKVSFGSNGEGAFLHMAAEMLRSQVGGYEYLHVPFKGTAQMTQEMMGGRVDVAFNAFTSIQQFVQAGKLRLLAIAKATRAPNYPDYPTVAETVPGFSSGGWFGFVAPASVPRDVIGVLNREFNAGLKLPDVRTKLDTLGLDLWTESPEYFGAMLKSEFEKYGKVARDIGLKPQ
jgi:tripartite-type tricarboxylate transporter receptor subunit TctC